MCNLAPTPPFLEQAPREYPAAPGERRRSQGKAQDQKQRQRQGEGDGAADGSMLALNNKSSELSRKLTAMGDELVRKAL